MDLTYIGGDNLVKTVLHYITNMDHWVQKM